MKEHDYKKWWEMFATLMARDGDGCDCDTLAEFAENPSSYGRCPNCGCPWNFDENICPFCGEVAVRRTADGDEVPVISRMPHDSRPATPKGPDWPSVRHALDVIRDYVQKVEKARKDAATAWAVYNERQEKREEKT